MSQTCQRRTSRDKIDLTPLSLVQRACRFAQRHIGRVHALAVDSQRSDRGCHLANIRLSQSHGAGSGRCRPATSQSFYSA